MNYNKNKLQNKKFILIIFLCMLLIAILFLIFFFKQSNAEKKEQNAKKISNLTSTYEKRQGDKYAIITNEEGEKEYSDKFTRSDIDANSKVTNSDDITKKEGEEFLKEFIDNIKNKTLEEEYNKLNTAYINTFDYSLDDFKANYTFDGGAIGELLKYEKNKSGTVYTIKFTEIATGYTRIVDFTKLSEDNSIIDKAIINIVDINKEKTVNKVKYKFTNRYDTNDGCIYTILINNASDRILDIDDMFIRDGNDVCIYDVVSKNDELKVYPGVEYKLQIKLTNVSSISSFILKCKTLENNIEEIEIYSNK